MEWAVREVRAMRRTAAPRYAVTSAMLECARALDMIGRDAEGRDCATESLTLARSFGFHEIEMRAEAFLQAREQSESASAPARFTRRSASVVRELSSMELPRLPEHVRPTAAAV